jgi:hypothetical protein
MNNVLMDPEQCCTLFAFWYALDVWRQKRIDKIRRQMLPDPYRPSGAGTGPADFENKGKETLKEVPKEALKETPKDILKDNFPSGSEDPDHAPSSAGDSPECGKKNSNDKKRTDDADACQRVKTACPFKTEYHGDHHSKVPEGHDGSDDAKG